MTKYTVEGSSLVAVADAIRTKGGTTNQLVFPDGFVNAIGNIQSGGGENYLASFVDGSITDITADMLNGCTKIKKNMFYYDRTLTSVVIPNSVTDIENYAFYNCTSLASVTIPDSVLTIGLSAFQATIFTSVVIPDSVTSIATNIFRRCSKLASVTISNSLTSIPDNSFRECTALTSVVIPDSVTSIGAYAFFDDSKLATVEMKPTIPPKLGSATAFGNCSKLTTIIVPAGTLSAYKSATNWSAHASKMVEASS